MRKRIFLLASICFLALAACSPKTDDTVNQEQKKSNIMGSGDKPMPKESDYK